MSDKLRPFINWGLLASLTANLAALRTGGSVHAVAGGVFAGFAALHIWKHRRAFLLQTKQNGNWLGHDMLSQIAGPKLQAAYFMKQVQVLHYLPGRIRFYSSTIHHHPEMALEVKNRLQQIPEILQYEINAETGSILVKYHPDSVTENPILAEIELIAQRQAGGLRK